MSTEISNLAAAGAGKVAPSPAASAPPSASPAVQANAAPRVQAPKPVAIQFDAAQVRASVQEAVSLLNQQINANNRGLGFHVDEALGAPVVTVRSADSGEVVRQIPNEVVVRVAHNIEKMKGLLFSAKA